MTPRDLDFHTFSIVARCPRTGDFGVAVATARPAVGAIVPWVSARRHRHPGEEQHRAGPAGACTARR